jgi:myo-inositol-1(or 4)-monophosphatase
VDPLDGTTDYVNGSTYHCVSVALAIEGRPVVGVVDRPATGDRYAAVAGEGATRNGEPIGVSSTADLGDAYLGTGISPPAATDEHYRALYDYCIREGNTQGVRQRGSAALDLCRVARGTFDGFFDMYTSPWDVAAGAFVLTEAGGRVTDYGGEPLDYSADERMIHVVGTNGQLHDRFLELAEALAPETG